MEHHQEAWRLGNCNIPLCHSTQLEQWGHHLCWGLDATAYKQATVPWTITAASTAQKTSCCICYGCRRELLQNSLQPCHPERARSRLISEAKQGRAWLVLGWENYSKIQLCCISDSKSKEYLIYSARVTWKRKKKTNFSFCSERHALIASKFTRWGNPQCRHEFRYWTAKKEWQMSTMLTLDKSLWASLFYNTREIMSTWLRRCCRYTYSFYNKYHLCARMQRCAGPF